MKEYSNDRFVKQMDRSTYLDRLLYTPKTPTMQRIRHHFNLIQSANPDSNENNEVNDSLQVFLKQTWNIFGVSSLFGFDCQNERLLKLYGKRLREEVAAILPQDNVTYDVEFTIDESINPRPTVTDPPATRIEIYTKNVEEENVKKCIYTGVLLSWGTSLEELDYEKSVKLPLLLCRGAKSTMAAVHLTLCNMFDCLIVALPATEDDLRWLVPVILQPNDTDEIPSLKGQVKLEYKIPDLTTTNGLAIKYDISVLAELWLAIHSNQSDLFSGILLTHVEKFHDVLQHQMLQEAGVQLGLGKLNKISFPSVTIMDNRMKAATSDVLTRVLSFFNEKSIEVLHTLNLNSTYGTNSIAS